MSNSVHNHKWPAMQEPKSSFGDGCYFAVMFFGFMFLLFYILFLMPTVYISHETRACVKVEDWLDRYDCENLPKRYEHVWTK